MYDPSSMMSLEMCRLRSRTLDGRPIIADEGKGSNLIVQGRKVMVGFAMGELGVIGGQVDALGFLLICFSLNVFDQRCAKKFQR